MIYEPGPEMRTCDCNGAQSMALRHLARIYELVEDGFVRNMRDTAFIATRLHYFWLQHPELTVVAQVA